MISNQKGNPFLVVFIAEWLGDGTIMDEIISQLAVEFNEKFGFYRIDIDQEPDIAASFGNGRLPNIVFFDKGELVDQIRGMNPKHFLKNRIEKLI